jgi:signal transduction histidine kinase
MLATTRFGPGALGSLVRFGLLALVPVVALGVVLAHVLNSDIQQRYLDTSKSSATLIAQVGIQPLLSVQQMTNGLSPAEVNSIDDKLHTASISNEVDRIKVWNHDGKIVYSDNATLIGKTFPIDDDLGHALTGQSIANITSGHDAENAGDYLNGPLIQVYAPLVFKGTSSPSGAFELYLPYAPVQAAIDRESNTVYLFLVAGLALFYLSMFPVVLLADRWRRRLLGEAQATALANLAVLERLNRLKTEFLTRISHQFRTALVGIQGFSELIKDSERLDMAEVRAYASDIYKDAEGLDRAFTEMLELDGIEAGRATLKVSRVDLNQLIERVVETTRKQNPDHVLAVELDASVPAVSCDEEKVSQVLTILLSNATKYSPAGREVSIASRASSDGVEMTVKDHGPGMPADLNGPQASGTGLGLEIARQIAEMHGGRMWFESSRGRGTEFHFMLPIRTRPSREMAAVARTKP